MVETVLARYHFKPDREQEFRSLLKRHWATLHKLEIWEPMEQCCNRTEFPHAEAVKL